VSTDTSDCVEDVGVVPLSSIERTLSSALTKVQQPDLAPVVRACLSNLVIFCREPERAAAIEKDIPHIVRLHPARVLLLVAPPGNDEGGIEAQVCVRRHRAVTGPAVYSEQVTLRASGHAVNRLPYVVRTLIIGDLPINLWWAVPQSPPLAGTLLFDLAEHAEQIIYDSTGWPEPAHGIMAAAAWLNRLVEEAKRGFWRTAADLNWRRLKVWRRLCQQALDPRTAPGAIESITELVIEHGPHGVMQAWLVGGWLAHRLGWQLDQSRVQPGNEVSWSFRTAHGTARVRFHRLPEGPPSIRHVRIACKLEGKAGALDFAVEDERRLAVVLEGVEAALPRTVALPREHEHDLVGQQLSDRERHPVFVDSMRLARNMANMVIGMDSAAQK